MSILSLFQNISCRFSYVSTLSWMVHHSGLTLHSTLSTELLLFLLVITNASFAAAFSSSILRPAQLAARSRGSGRPLVIFSNEQMQRTGAERTASACLRVCVCESLSVTFLSYQFSHHALLNLTQQHSSGEVAQNRLACLLTHLHHCACPVV